MTARLTFRAGLTALALALLAPSEASARGLLLITHGNTIHELGEITPEQRGAAQGAKVGFKNDYVGVFWINLWTWGGTFCVYTPEGYEPIDRPTAARLLGRAEDRVTPPFLYRYPLGLLIVGVPVALFVLLGVVLEFEERSRASRLLTEPPYQRALEIAGATRATAAGPVGDAGSPEEAKAQASSAALEVGVKYLTDSGVPREEAERNLRMLLRRSEARTSDS